MLTNLLLAALLGCSTPEAPVSDAPTPAAPKPATTPEPVAELPPPPEPLGGPLVLINGNFLADEIKLGDGEEVQVICGDRLVTARVNMVPVGEGRVTPLVADCPKFEALFRGLSDRIGSGSIKPGIGKGPFGPAKPKDFEGGYTVGVLRVEDVVGKPEYKVVMDPDQGDKIVLAEMASGPGAVGLNWVGDLDDDNVADFVINTPHSRTVAHTRLYLSAKSATRQPEQIADTKFTLW